MGVGSDSDQRRKRFWEAQMLLTAHFYSVIPVFSSVTSYTVLSCELGCFLPNFSHLKLKHSSFTVYLCVC